MSDPLDLLVVGAGPSGLAMALSARKRDLSCAVIERGRIAENIARFPRGLIFFGGRWATEIGTVPHDSHLGHPTREDMLSYLNRVAALARIDVRTETELLRIEGSDGAFEAIAEQRGAQLTLRARKIVLATGVFGRPRALTVPGAELAKVDYGYHDPYQVAGQRVAIIGDGNGAAEAALRLHYEARAAVTVVSRHHELPASKWRWHLADIAHAIGSGAIRVLFDATLVRIDPHSITLSIDGREVRLDNDRVIALCGYQTDGAFLARLEVPVDGNGAPAIDPRTLESRRPGIYVAGALTAGSDPDLILICGSRNHGRAILAHLHGEPPPVEDLDRRTRQHWMQFERLEEEVDDLGLSLVPVVGGDFRDNLIDVHQRRFRETVLRGEDVLSAWAEGSEATYRVEELLNAEARGDKVIFRGRTLPKDALEVLALCDGRSRVRDIVATLAERHEQEFETLCRPVMVLISSLLRSGALTWRAETL